MKCTHIKDNGKPCGANAMKGARFCYLHNPAVSTEEKTEARSRGGLKRGVILGQPLPEIALDQPADTVKILQDTIRRVRAGELDVRIANSIGILSGQLLKAFEVTGARSPSPKGGVFARLKMDRFSDDVLEEATR